MDPKTHSATFTSTSTTVDDTRLTIKGGSQQTTTDTTSSGNRTTTGKVSTIISKPVPLVGRLTQYSIELYWIAYIGNTATLCVDY